jgi:hypothetical protein
VENHDRAGEFSAQEHGGVSVGGIRLAHDLTIPQPLVISATK